MPHLLSSWPLCEPLSPSVPGSHLCSQLRRKGENPEQEREAPFPSPPSGWPCAPATPLTRSQRSLPASGCARCTEGTSGHRWPLALPEQLLLRALWAPSPGRQHSNSAGSRHSCQNQGGCLGKPRTEPTDFGRQPGCAAGQEEEQLSRASEGQRLQAKPLSLGPWGPPLALPPVSPRMQRPHVAAPSRLPSPSSSSCPQFRQVQGNSSSGSGSDPVPHRPSPSPRSCPQSGRKLAPPGDTWRLRSGSSRASVGTVRPGL